MILPISASQVARITELSHVMCERLHVEITVLRCLYTFVKIVSTRQASVLELCNIMWLVNNF
jgi:hypothetical protein